MPMPWSLTAISTMDPSVRVPTRDARVRGRVRDRVDEQVAQRREQLALVSVDEPLARVAGDELDVLAGRLGADLVDRAPHEVVDVDDLRAGERVVALQAGQVDDVLDEVAEAGRLHLHALREVAHLLGVVAGGRDGFGQQGERAHGGLELVADVGHEVAPDDVDTALLGEVVDQDEDRPGPQGATRTRSSRSSRPRGGRRTLISCSRAWPSSATRSIRCLMSGIVTASRLTRPRPWRGRSPAGSHRRERPRGTPTGAR